METIENLLDQHATVDPAVEDLSEENPSVDFGAQDDSLLWGFYFLPFL